MSTPRDSKYRLPSKPTVMTVGPEIAGDWLDHRNTGAKNRHMSKTTAVRYANAMRRGEWKLTAQALSFDTDGHVLDGQHRLWAVALCGIPQEFWVFPEEPRDTFALYDTGLRKSAAQLLQAANRSVVAAAVKYLAVADNLYPPRFAMGAAAELTNTQALDLVRVYGTTLETAARIASGSKNHAKIPAAPYAAVVTQVLQTEHADMLDEWTDGLNTGANLTPGDPRLRLRNVFLGATSVRAAATRTQAMPYGLAVKAWNAYVADRPVHNLIWKQGTESVPLVVGYEPKNPKSTE